MWFATCDRAKALEYIQVAFPKKELKDEGTLAEILDKVEADCIRITDPHMHGNVQIIPGDNWKEEDCAEVATMVEKMQKELG